jgi:hypothetical protein
MQAAMRMMESGLLVMLLALLLWDGQGVVETRAEEREAGVEHAAADTGGLSGLPAGSA